MNAWIRFTLILLAGVAGGAMAQPNADAPAPTVQGFIASAAVATAANDEARARPANMASPCTRSTFTELGHGHGDVADAGYGSVHCPQYDQRAEAGERSEL